jgi:hypothetical protein
VSFTKGFMQSIIADKMSPKSIIAFIKYFALRVVGSRYAIKQFHTDTLIQLTEALVYRRISSKVYRYSTPTVQEKDSTWRKKCYLCQFIDPTSYGVLMEYAFGPQPGSDTNKGTSSDASVMSPAAAVSDVSSPPSPISKLKPADLSDDFRLPDAANAANADGTDEKSTTSQNEESPEGADDEQGEARDVLAPLYTPYSTALSASHDDVSRSSIQEARSVSVAEAREQLRSASTDQFRAIFSQMAFPPKRDSSSSKDDSKDHEVSISATAVDQSGFEKLLEGPTFEPGEQRNSQATASDFISKYNKKGDEVGDIMSVSGATDLSGRSSSSATSASTSSSVAAEAALNSSPKLSKFRASSSGAPPSVATGSLAAMMKDSVPFSNSGKGVNKNNSSSSVQTDNEDSEEEILSARVTEASAALPSLETLDYVDFSPLGSPTGDVSPQEDRFNNKRSTKEESLFRSQYAESDRGSLSAVGGVSGEFRESLAMPHALRHSSSSSHQTRLASSPSKASSNSDIDGASVADSVSASAGGGGHFSNLRFHKHGTQHRNFCDGDSSICSICKEISLVGRLLNVNAYTAGVQISSSSSSSSQSERANFGKPYARSTKVMGFVGSCVTPRVCLSLCLVVDSI